MTQNIDTQTADTDTTATEAEDQPRVVKEREPARFSAGTGRRTYYRCTSCGAEMMSERNLRHRDGCPLQEETQK